MQLDINIVDAFTNQVFKGNSAAVIMTQRWLLDSQMQNIAIENNLSETAFLVQMDDNNYAIRWFSPLTEIDFCGHATLAAAFVIFNARPQINNIVFSTNNVGELTVCKAGEFIEMSFPNMCPKPIEDIPKGLQQGLSIAPKVVLQSSQAYFVVYENEQDVLTVVADDQLLLTLAPYDVVVTARSSKTDFVSRYFWPANGGDEDPVTGSIHAGLAPYWAKELNKSSLTAYQASNRGGHLLCRIEGGRVIVAGQAVQYLQGVISV